MLSHVLKAAAEGLKSNPTSKGVKCPRLLYHFRC